MTDRHPELDGFDALIGTWETEATHPLFPATVVPGHVTFEWLTGGHYLLQRSHYDHEKFPDGLAVVGRPEVGDELLAEYFDSRGVRRTYRTSLQDGVWRTWRDAPGFDQRSEATLAPDAFEVVHRLAREPGAWKDDLRVTYRRRA